MDVTTFSKRNHRKYFYYVTRTMKIHNKSFCEQKRTECEKIFPHHIIPPSLMIESKKMRLPIPTP